MKKFGDIFRCCSRGGKTSRDLAYLGSNDSIDNLSMISVTYGLESFTKNALLIFCQVTNELGNRNRDIANKEVEILKETFHKYRFEVETHIDLSSSEVEQKCNEFFARDFSEFGAVAVVILSPNGELGSLSASDKMFHENIIIKHFTSHIPESLKGKPKIYITEANRSNSSFVNDRVIHSVPISDNFEDILGLHIPIIMERPTSSPLQMFCNRMNTSDDYGNLIGIVIGTIQEIEETYPELHEKLELTCTFRKRFTLPMFVLLE